MHALDEHPDVISLSPQIFAGFVDQFSTKNIRATTLTQAMEGVRDDTSPTYGLTFDDGYASVYEHAFEVLAAKHFTATIFLTLGEAGTLPDLYGRATLSWNQIHELHAAGFEIGAHTLTHPDLTQCNATRLQREVVDAKHMLEDRLGSAVTTFAYPFGAYNAKVAALVAQHYDYAVTTEFRLTQQTDLHHLIPRIDTYYFRMAPFQSLLTSTFFSKYVAMRGFGRRIRGLFSA